MTGFEILKPVLTALVLPPVPWLLMIVVAARSLPRRPRRGYFFVCLGVALVWLSSCQGVGRWLLDALDLSPPPLSAADLAELKGRRDASTAIVVLGGGLVADLTRPGQSDLSRVSLERLRYGIRLSRSTGLPLAFTGGRGWGQRTGTASEAALAQVSAEEDFKHPVRWIESESRDTHENAIKTLALLEPQGIRDIVLVTHAVHMPRAMMLFQQAAGGAVRMIPAPMGHYTPNDQAALDWLPTIEGYEQVRLGLREWLGQQVARSGGAPKPAAATATK